MEYEELLLFEVINDLTDLILVPTPAEKERIEPLLTGSGTSRDWAFQLCGFGPIAAAARAAALISRYKPERVLLLGIAGSFDVQRYPVGSACRFDRVASYGIGVGSGQDFQSAQSLGWEQFSGNDARPRVSDVVQLTSSFIAKVPCHGLLLTSCAAAANPLDVEHRQRLFPDAAAEDMEGYGVAMACTLAGVPLQIVRGISNQVGQRDHDQWQVETAIEAAVKMARRVIAWRWIPTES